MDFMSTCPNCTRVSRFDADDTIVYCPRCDHRYDLRDDDDVIDTDPDYGGAFDGFGVQSDADSGL
jgi:hypothetical protein